MNLNQFSQRSRQSTAGPTPRRSGASERPTPGPSRQSTTNNAARGAAELPPYEVPLFTLNPAGQRALAALIRSHDVQKLDRSLADAQSELSNAASQINDRLTQRVQHTGEARSKRRRNEDDDEDDDSGLTALQEQLNTMQNNVTGMTSRMEETMRKLIDGRQGVKWMAESVNAAAEDARNNASTQASTQNIRTQRRRRTRGTAEDGEEDDDEDEDEEEIEDFEPTDPGAGTQPDRAPLNVFKARMESAKTRFQSDTLNHRYAQDNEYISFRRSVHDSMYPNDDVPLPPPDEWFNDDGTVAPPGQTRRREEDEEDDEIQIERANISTKCVLTLREFEDVVTSTKCDHSFEKSAIYSLMGGRGNVPVQCPVGGCKEVLSKADLKVDAALVRKIRRLQKAKETQADASEDDDDFGGATQGTAQVIDEDDSDTEVGAAGPSTQRTQMKQEPKATATQPPASSQAPRGTQVIDLGDDDEDEEMEDD